MKRWKLKIILKSDLCTATGEDRPGIINIKTALENGIPYIPAKRIKGCLLEAGKEMQENGVIEKESLERIFGTIGAERTEGIYVEDAQLSFVPDELGLDRRDGMPSSSGQKTSNYGKDWYDGLRREARDASSEEKTFLEEILTRRRTRTAMEAEKGTAEEHSLRTMQVVPAGIQFEAEIEGDLKEAEEEILKLCVKGFRHLGIGITRGFGEITCRLEKEAEWKESGTVSEKTGEENAEDRITLGYEMILDTPVAAETETDTISGGQIQGAFAGAYLKYVFHGDPSKKENAHEDPTFRRIFLRDGVQFGNAFPKWEGRLYVPCPKGIVSKKNSEAEWFCVKNHPEIRKRQIKASVCLEKNALHCLRVQKEIHFHHARPVNRGIGHALNDRAMDASVPTGEFYQYTAFSKGQRFQGSLRGRKADLQILRQCLEKENGQIRLGRSKTAEYGKCTVRFLDQAPQKENPKKASEWLLWLATPLISAEPETGSVTLEDGVFRSQLEEVLGCGIQSFEKLAVNYCSYSGYNSKWRLPLPACPAMDAGSTFYLKLSRPIEDGRMQGYRFGERTGRGCGQVMAIPWEKDMEGRIVFEGIRNPEKNSADREKIREFIQPLIEQKEEEKQVTEAWEKYQDSGKEMPSSTAIQQLLQFVENSKEEDLLGAMKNAIGCLKREDKRKRMLDLVESCGRNEKGFLRLYLEYAKWEARRKEET